MLESFLLKKRLCHWCFPVNFAKFLRTSILIEHMRWLIFNNITLLNSSTKMLILSLDNMCRMSMNKICEIVPVIML